METKRQLTRRIRILAALAVFGAVAVGLGVWFLVTPIHISFGETCGSTYAQRFPPGDDSAVSTCIQQWDTYRNCGWSLIGVGVLGLAAGGRAAYLRRLVLTAPVRRTPAPY